MEQASLQANIPSVESLTLEQKAGQVLCLGWQGRTDAESRTVNAHALEIVEGMHAGAVVLLGRNVGDPIETRATVAKLQSISKIPLLVAVDQEGGGVNRFKDPFHEFPGNMALGAIACGSGLAIAGELTERQAAAQASELRSIGINWNFAPVLDINNNPDNPIIGVRSYGEDPALVGHLGIAAIRGYQSAGIMACAKHFPGHGDTSVDSHHALPMVNEGRARLDRIELAPFRTAIEQDVPSIMTTHILFNALDRERPATISRTILTKLLRKEFGYDGLVITDCLEMNAIANTVGTARGAVEALKAGADMGLICHTLEVQQETYKAIIQAVLTGELPVERLDEAVERVLHAKRDFSRQGSHSDEFPWLRAEHHELEAEIARRSITIVRNNGLLPISANLQGSLMIYSADVACEQLARYMQPYHKKSGSGYIGPELRDNSREAAMSHAYREARVGGMAVILTVPREAWAEAPVDQEKQAEFVRGMHAIYGDRLIVVALKEPYDIRRFPEVENYICTYGYGDCRLRALAEVLFAASQPQGKLPVSIPGVYDLIGIVA
jgi:beta-N-acetylhexosaminidase